MHDNTCCQHGGKRTASTETVRSVVVQPSVCIYAFLYDINDIFHFRRAELLVFVINTNVNSKECIGKLLDKNMHNDKIVGKPVCIF